MHPSIVYHVIQGKTREEIESKVIRLESERTEKGTLEFIADLKRTSHYHLNPNDRTKLNRLCYVEDWENLEIKGALVELQDPDFQKYINRKYWEWAMGLIAMRRLGKLNEKSTAIGVGAGKEPFIFYLANKINHVYATDLYEGREWKEAPADFPENPNKYVPFPYREHALTVARMNGTKLEFPSDNFDIAFSFSSIEHFGGKHHSGALQSLREMERVLKPGGIAVITTEYILNNKTHYEFFNKQTIYSDLIDRVEMKLVEPLDLRVTTGTLDTVMEIFDAIKWNDKDDDYKKTHPTILLRLYDILFTSVMLVFEKH